MNLLFGRLSFQLLSAELLQALLLAHSSGCVSLASDLVSLTLLVGFGDDLTRWLLECVELVLFLFLELLLPLQGFLLFEQLTELLVFLLLFLPAFCRLLFSSVLHLT